MTNEEATGIMSKVTFYWELGEQTLTQNQINEALDLAIEALREPKCTPECKVAKRLFDESFEPQPTNPRPITSEGAYVLDIETMSVMTNGEYQNKQEAQPCEDCISRQAVLDLFNKSDEYRWETTWIRKKIEKLPSVTQSRPKGHNENNDYAECDQFVCSECGIELQDWHRVERDIDDGDITYHEYTFKYCPNCGAEMEGNNADSD